MSEVPSLRWSKVLSLRWSVFIIGFLITIVGLSGYPENAEDWCGFGVLVVLIGVMVLYCSAEPEVETP